MTRDQMGTCITLAKEPHKHGVLLPQTDLSPIPGLCLFVDEGHQHLEMVQADGTVVDLLAVFRAAEDCVRNWHKGDTFNLPQFVGDFGRLTAIAKAVNGRKP